MLIVTIFLLPMSLCMNRLIYHHPVMRGVIGVLVLMGSVISFVVVLVLRLVGRWEPSHYFGLIPLIPGSSDVAEPTGWFASMVRFFRVLIHPFLANMDGAGDVAGYTNAIEPLLVSKSALGAGRTVGGMTVHPGVVSEEFFAEGRQLAQVSDKQAWDAGRSVLGGIGKVLLSGVGGASTPAPAAVSGGVAAASSTS